MRVLVTGAAGFIGSHVCGRLLARGDHVVGLDLFDDFYDPARKRRSVAALAADRFRLVEGDIRDPAAVAAAFGEAVDVVVHLAARAGVRPSIANPALYASVNVDGTVALLEACRARGVRRFVFASSSSVYGGNTKVPFHEDDPVDRPVSPYAATKKAGELLCHTYHHLHGLRISSLRFFTVYGPRQRPEMAIHAFSKAILAGQSVQLFGADTSRDYTYVDDVVDGVLAAMDHDAPFRVYNLGNSSPVDLVDLVGRLERVLGKKAYKESLPMQPGDVQATCADVSRAKAELGWAPKIPMDEGLARFAAWLRAGEP